MNWPLGLFLVLAPLLLAGRKRLPNRLQHGAVIALAFILCGWALLCFSVWLHCESLARLVAATPNPSDALLDRMQSDGAPQVFTLLFGWAYSGIYFGFWWVGMYVYKRVFRPGRA